jgi:hypothetical protein
VTTVLTCNDYRAVHIVTTVPKALSGCGARTEACIARKRLQNKRQARPVPSPVCHFATAHRRNITVSLSSVCATSGT